MTKKLLPNWEKYWANFKDLSLLREKSDNLDDTLRLIEKEFATKLLSGDHLQLVDALDDRIDELERLASAQKSSLQTSLFDEV